jgi:LmbE family N-acetylglucosaminyl deacetylase
MAEVVFISPHLDDVVLSCSRWVLHERQFHKVRIVSVFTDCHDAEVRREEDAKAAAVLDVEITHLGLPDAPLIGYRGFADLIFGPTRPVGPVAAALEPLLYNAHTVYGPLGVGGHVDHQATCEAVRSLGLSNTRFYEDQPYAAAPGAVAQRLGRPWSKARFQDHWLAAAWVLAHTHPSDRRGLLNQYPSVAMSNPPRQSAIQKGGDAMVAKARHCYASQWAFLTEQPLDRVWY